MWTRFQTDLLQKSTAKVKTESEFHLNKVEQVYIITFIHSDNDLDNEHTREPLYLFIKLWAVGCVSCSKVSAG